MTGKRKFLILLLAVVVLLVGARLVAVRIPFTGSIQDPETNLFATMASVLRNAFISAFARSLEGSICAT
jgi:hypothetical protein